MLTLLVRHPIRPERRVEPDLAHHPAGGAAVGYLPGWWNADRDRRRDPEHLLLAQGADGFGLDLPLLLLPTGLNDLLTTDKWGAGPTAVELKQSNGWTRGVLANHIWSFAGDDDRADVSATFLQPFLTYTTPTQWTFAVNTESSYNWENEQWSVPVNANAPKLMRFGTQLVSLGGGVRYWLDSPDAGAEGFGVRIKVTLLFPL